MLNLSHRIEPLQPVKCDGVAHHRDRQHACHRDDRNYSRDIEEPRVGREEPDGRPEQGDDVTHAEQNSDLGGAEFPVGEAESPQRVSGQVGIDGEKIEAEK